MTEQHATEETTTEATEQVQEAAQQPQGTPQAEGPTEDQQDAAEGDQETEGDQDQEPGHGTKKLRAEAAKYRQRMKDAEAEVEAVKAQLDTTRQQAADLLLTGQISADVQLDDGRTSTLVGQMRSPGDLFAATGTTPADYTTDDGTINGDQLRAAAVQLLSAQPQLQARKPDPRQGDFPDSRPASSFTDAFAPKKV